jgi:hypothetical protein
MTLHADNSHNGLDPQSLRSAILADKNVTVEDIPDDGLRIAVHPPRHRPFRVSLAYGLFGVVGILISSFTLLHPIGPGKNTFLEEQGYKILAIGIILSASSPLIFIIMRLQGPPRDAVVEVWQGKMTADRSIMGDRARNYYLSAETFKLYVDFTGQLYIKTRMDSSPLIRFGKRTRNIAIAKLIGEKFWFQRELTCGELKKREGKQWEIFPADNANSTTQAQDRG